MPARFYLFCSEKCRDKFVRDPDQFAQRRARQHRGDHSPGLVAWLKSAWPDLIVAGVIALPSLHSAAEIIRDAGTELREPQAA